VDSTATTTNTNPITLNGRGEASIWIPPNVAFKFVEFDSYGNLIKTTDQVTVAQLLTLWGGTDSGSASAYVLTFTASFSAYANGTVIYWVPANSNTGAATLNVNGLGAIPILNPTGGVLGANQIQAGLIQQVIFYNGTFYLQSLNSFSGATIGTFGAETGLTAAATTDLGSATAHVVAIGGTTTITGFGSSASLSAPIYTVRFTNTLTLTNSTSLILPGATNITTSSGDWLLAQYLGNGNWKVLSYQHAQGNTQLKIKAADTSVVSSTTLTNDPDLFTGTLAVGRYSFELYLLIASVSGAAGFKFTNTGTAVDTRGVVPALAVGYINGAAYGPKNDTFYGTTVTYAAVSTAADTNQVTYKGSILVGTAGTFGIAWAQNTSTASNTTLEAGSYLSLSLLNTGSSTGPFQHIYTTAGSGTETIPTGYTTLTIEVWGGSGGGGSGYFNLMPTGTLGGGGGGSGGYAKSTYTVTGAGGQTIAYTVGAAGAGGTYPGNGTAGGTSSTASGTFTITSISCTGGGGGGQAGTSIYGSGGTAGAASGGNVTNTSGNVGNAGTGSGGGAGGFGIAGLNDTGNLGGMGAASPYNGYAGGTGIVVFSYQ
jgi:hypothetical protein